MCELRDFGCLLTDVTHLQAKVVIPAKAGI